MKFKFGDRVRVTMGFHKGRAGVCTDYNDFKDINSLSAFSAETKYYVRFENQQELGFKAEELEQV